MNDTPKPTTTLAELIAELEGALHEVGVDAPSCTNPICECDEATAYRMRLLNNEREQSDA